MTDDRLDYLLELWAEWLHRGEWVEGYPHRATVLRTLAGDDFDDMVEAADESQAESVQACIDGLELHHQAALAHRYSEAVWRFPRMEFALVLQDARMALSVALNRRGIE